MQEYNGLKSQSKHYRTKLKLKINIFSTGS